MDCEKIELLNSRFNMAFKHEEKDMIRYITFITILTLTVCSYAAGGDTLPSLPSFGEKMSRNPEAAFALLDSLDKSAAHPTYKIDFLRSYAYRSLSKYYMAMRYAQRVLESQEASADTVTIRRAYMVFAESAISSFRLNEAVQYIVEGEHYAREIADRSLEASMLLMEAEVYRKMSMIDKGYQCVSTAIGLLTESRKATEVYQLSHILGYLMAYYIEDKKLHEAWQAGEKRQEAIKLLEEVGANKLTIDDQKGYFYSKMAYLAYKMGKYVLAEDYYHRFCNTFLATTAEGRLEINDYLLEKGNFERVLRHNNAYFKATAAEDSLSIVYFRALHQSSKAYHGLGAYHQAYEALSRLHSIQEQMRISNERNQLFDVGDLTRAVKREYELKQAANKVETRNYVILGLSLISVVLLLLLGRIFLDRKIIRRKDRKMTSLILLLDDKNQYQTVAENEPLPSSKNLPAVINDGIIDKISSGQELTKEEDGDELLFQAFDQHVKEMRLYLNYQLSRDDYARLMGVDRNRFASILKEFTQGNLSSYLNGLRLEYSVRLFRSHPDWSINDVATESALPSLSTFYRLFKEKYGISPNAFRNQLANRENQQHA